MKFVTSVLLGLLLPLCLHATALGSLEITPAPGWVEVPATKPGQPGSRFPTIRFAPADDRNASVLLTLIPAQLARVHDLESLKALHRVGCTPYLASPDAVVKVTKFSVPDGLGVYATFEDPDLVGKPPVKENYKFSSPVAFYFKRDFVIHATVFTDSVPSPDFTEALQIIKSATVRTAAAVKGGPDANVIVIDLRPHLQGRLSFPRTSFKDYEPKLNSDPGYFAFTGENGVMLSGWLDEAKMFPGMTKFWASEKASLQNKGGIHPQHDTFKKIGDWFVVSYTIALNDTVSQKNLRACQVVGDTWADLHLSITGPAGTWDELEAALKSISFAKADANGG